jgi:hypothetical protein
VASKKPDGLSEEATKALAEVEKSTAFHDDFVRKAEERWDSFEGRLRASSDAAQWQSQLHPPYINHIVETTVAGLLEDRLQFRVKPKPRFWNPGEYQSAQQGAKAHEILFRCQLAADRFNEFQRPFVLSAAVTRLGVAKTFWKKDVRPVKKLITVNAVPEDLRAFVPPIPVLQEVERKEALFNGPVTEAVDPRDFYWHEAAVSLDKARWVAHAVWMSLDDLKKLQKDGVYDNVDVLEKPSEGMDDEVERRREERGRKKDMIEVLEIWNRETGRVVTLGGRKTVLRARDWPFWHQQYPFVVTSLQPFPFSLQGMSIVEKLAHLQEAVWDIQNKQHDNLALATNQIHAVSVDLIDDIDALVFEPGAMWPVSGDAQNAVQAIVPDTTAITIAMPAMSGLTTTMQNLAGGQPFTTTSEARGMGANTATEAALVTNLGQRAVASMKAQIFYAYGRIGEQRMKLNQQFIREPVYVEQIGLDGQEEQQEILPYLLQGDYLFDTTPMSESLMRQEKRAENQGMFQVMIESQAVAAASGSPWNIKAGQERLLESYDIEDKEQFFSSTPPAGVAPAASGGGAPSAPEGPGGVTAPQSIDPAVSPSNQSSIAPSVHLQRAGAMGGGVVNQ